MQTTTRANQQPRLAGLAITLVLVLAACSAAATVAPSPSPTPAPTPSPTPTLAPSPTPSAVPTAETVVDAAAGLTIAAPYTIASLDPAIEATLRQQLTASLTALGSLITIGAREALLDGAVAGYIIVMGFPGGVLTDTTYAGAVGGIAASSKVTLKAQTISGIEVSSGASATAAYGIFRVGDHMVIVFTPPTGSADPIVKALITANS